VIIAAAGASEQVRAHGRHRGIGVTAAFFQLDIDVKQVKTFIAT